MLGISRLAFRRGLHRFSKVFLSVVFLVLLSSLTLYHNHVMISSNYSLSEESADYVMDGFHTGKSRSSAVNDLFQKVKVLCLILTNPNNSDKMKAVEDTWAAHCNGHIFITKGLNDSLRFHDPGLPESRNHLWGKSKSAFRHAYKYHLDKYDWFYKADDDTYAIMENMRYMLKDVKSSKAVYYGSHINHYKVKSGYMSGGAGYVLSRESVRRLIERGLEQKRCRNDSGGDEDVEMGRCLEKVGVRPGNSRDQRDRGRFFPFNLTYHMTPGHMNRTTDWYPRHTHANDGDLLDCCSDTLVAVHYVPPLQMYEFEFFVYRLRMNSDQGLN